MSLKSHNDLAAIAMSAAHDLWRDIGGCVSCDSSTYEMHEVLGKQQRPYLGALVCVLGVTLIPLCKKCHERVEDLSLVGQLIFAMNKIPPQITAKHIEAIKARSV